MNSRENTQNVNHLLVLLIWALVLLVVTLLWLGLRPQAAASPLLPFGTPALQVSSVKPFPQALGQRAVADIAATANPYVVHIQTENTAPDPGSRFNLPFRDMDSFLERHGTAHQTSRLVPRQERQSTGKSGIIYRSDGYILTSNEALGTDNILVRLADARIFKGRVAGRDTFTNLAVVKIDARNLPVAKLGSTRSLRVGDWIVGIGNPLGLGYNVSFGIVSSLNRSLLASDHDIERIQTDAHVDPGSSGGPLMNIAGEVIGVNTAERSREFNLGQAIPIEVAQQVAQTLIARGKIDHPYIGVYLQNIDEQMRTTLGLPDGSTGTVVIRVRSGSPAAKAGLLSGDLIIKANGKPVETSQQLRHLIAMQKVGGNIALLVSRNGTLTVITIKVGDYPDHDRVTH